MNKVCSKCKQSKLRSEFYPHRSKWDGLQTECKDCKRITRNGYERRPAAKMRRLEAQARWAAAHPEKAMAYRIVTRAKKRGELIQQPCTGCGNPKTEAHHHNGYAGAAATDVTWLCKDCHVREHMKPGPRNGGFVLVRVFSGVRSGEI